VPLADTTETTAVLGAYFGKNTAAVPSSHTVALWVGDIDTGTEYAYPGYARQTLTNNTTNWVDNGDGSITATVTFPAATGASTTDDADRWVLFNGTGRVAWEFLASPLAIDGAGTVEPLSVTVYQASDDVLP
jgi:hypothetical protein